MTLSLHKLWAGSGYEYLTRQVARQDVTHPGRSPLASYYTELGETPGLWVGSGLTGVEGLKAGDVVTAEQMRALFGQGLHPLAHIRAKAARASGAGTSETAKARLLGSPFRSRAAADGSFETAVKKGVAARRRPSSATPAELQAVRAEVVSEVAAVRFERQHGRAPADPRELSATVARWSGGPAQPVAGFDLTFSPVKSVSALWAVAPPPVAAEIEQCHRAAVEDALRFVEERALFSREGARGVRQVEVTGLVGTAFTHRDSRAGDPDLHTHVAVANKVQTRQGKWLAIDGRVLYAATVAASETYNTAVERHLEERLGLRFAARPAPTPGEIGRRAVREVVGVDPRLLEGWSSRRRDVNMRRAELGRDFQQRTGRPPTRREAWSLAQQATLETRQAKHEPRTLAEQRTAWAAQAAALLGGRHAVDAMVIRALAPRPEVARAVDATSVAETARQVLSAMEAERATWGRWHLQAEAQRQVRTLNVPPGMVEHVVDLIVGEAANLCVPLNGPGAIQVPAELRRSDGSSVYEVTDAQRWTSTRVLAAEEQIVAGAARWDGCRVDPATVEVALQQSAVEGRMLNAGQAGLVRDLAGSGARVQLALAPAGTGKTTALRVLASAWTSGGGNVVGLAPSAAAAAVLGEQLDGPTDTLAKLVWSLDHPHPTQPDWIARLGSKSMVVVDEAGLADSPSLARVIGHVLKVGGSVRLVGDDQQLGAVGAGGLLRDLAARHGAVRLDDVVRFDDPAEAAASLALRDGRPEALGFYLDEHRVHVGDPTTTADQLFAAWMADRGQGLDSLMLAPTRNLVADLNARARTARLETTSPTPASSPSDDRQVTLADQNQASVGDTIITRTNDRRLTTSRGTAGQRWVRNGDRWTITHVHPDGRLTVSSLRDGQNVTIPSHYVHLSVELGYANTIHMAQGSTCDTVHGLLTGRETRAQLYTLLTRGRTANHAYLQLDPDAGVHELTRPDTAPLRTATQALERILYRDSDDRSATGTRNDLHNPALRLPDEIDRYLDSLRLAAEHTTPPKVDLHLTATAERLVPGLTDEPAWPTLHSQLLLHATTGADPVHCLTLAVALQPLDDPDKPAHDRAAVLRRRIACRQAPPSGGPLPWLPPVPDRLLEHPTWGPYLTARATLLDDLATRVAANAVERDADKQRRTWTTVLPGELNPHTIGDIAIWRASQRIPNSDPSPLGPPPADPTLQPWHQRLETATSSTNPRGVVLPPTTGTGTDPFSAQLTRHLVRLVDQGVDIEGAMQAAAAEQALPDDHPSAALWWRLHRHVPGPTLTTPSRREDVRPDLIPQVRSAGAPTPTESMTPEGRIDTGLLVAGLLRLSRPQPVPARAPSDLPPARRAVLLHINELTLHYYQDQYPESWSARYLTQRCGIDLRDDPRFSPGHAPAGWTHLVDHLRDRGITDQDMLDAGVARRTQRGHLIDLFRDRLVLPIWDADHDLLAFVARRHDHRGLTEAGPKYLNTPTTALYGKNKNLYGAHLLPPPAARAVVDGSEAGAFHEPQVAVLVEGPIDAIAVNLAAGNRHTALATLGTALTDQQAALIADRKIDVVLALDPDAAGMAAAERAFWTLTAANLDPRIATLPAATDPADLYRRAGADSIRTLLDDTERLGDQITRRTTQEPAHPELIDELLRIAAARPPHTWAESLDQLSDQHGLDPTQLRGRLLQHLKNDPGTHQERPHAPKTRRTDAPSAVRSTPRTSTSPDQRRTVVDDSANTARRSASVESPRR